MTKKVAEQAQTKLDAKGRTRIAAAVVDAVSNIGKSGNIVTQVCEVAKSAANGLPLSKDDADAIVAQVSASAPLRAMKPRTRDNTLSRWRTTLAVYDVLPEAERALREKMKRATWHEVFSLASALKSGKTPAQAVALVAARMNGKKSGGAAEIDNMKDAKREAAKLCKRILNVPHLPKSYVSALRELCEEYSINVGAVGA
jgi:hypothetical protein